MQDLNLASQAQQQGQQQYSWGQGLFNTAYNPLTASLNTAKSVEDIGQSPYVMSNQLASNVANQANNAAPYQYKATSYDPNASMISGLLGNQQLVNGIGSMFGGGNNPLGNMNNWDTSGLSSIMGNNATMSSTPNYMDAAGQLPSLDYSNFVWG